MLEKKIHSLRKNTTLSVLLNILKRRKISLLSPNGWTDKNDAFVMDRYREAKGKNFVCATCFSIDDESVYHWDVFSKGDEGCCLVLNADVFLERLNAYHSLKYGEVEYLPVDFKERKSVDEYPFLKRKQFACEKEFRLVFLSDDCETYDIDLPLEAIRCVILSDSMPKNVAESIKQIIDMICPGVKVHCSTLNENAQWKNHFRDECKNA